MQRTSTGVMLTDWESCVTQGRRTAALLLLAAALGLAALGQFFFFHRRDYLWDGVVFHGLAVLCFVLAWRQATVRLREPRPARSRSCQLSDWVRGRPVPTALMSLGLFLSFAATLLAQRRAWNQSTGDIVLLWLLGVGAVVAAALLAGDCRSPAAFLPRSIGDWRARLRGVSRESWLEIAVVAGLTLLALTLRVAGLERIPYTLGGDEAWHGLLARQVLDGQLRNPFVMGYMSMPTLFYWPLSWSLWLAGNGVMGLRLPAALAGTATVPILYLFARHLWGKRTAVLSALFLATYETHIHYSRLGANNVWDPLFVLLTLWLLDLGLASPDETRRTRFFTLTGLVMGLSAYFYTGARLLPLLVAVYLAFVWIKRRGQRELAESTNGYVWPLLMLVLAFLVTAGPMLSYALSHPDDWNARINQVGIIQSGWLEQEPNLTGKSTLRILAEQFLRSAGAFHVYPDRTVWYGADRPLLGFLAGLFAVLGMGWAVIHWRERRYFLVLIWLWAVIITGGMLTESPPSSQRLVLAIPAVALLVAIGLEQSVGLFGRLLDPKRRQWENVALGMLVLILVVGSVRFYFVEYTPSRRYGSANGETATMMGHYLSELDGGTQAYLFGAPRIYWSFGSMSFLAPDVPGQDVVEPLDAPPDFMDGSRGAVFLFLPERTGELAWVQQAYPGGHLQEFRDAAGQMRFIAYKVP